jgi:hypothetical protein
MWSDTMDRKTVLTEVEQRVREIPGVVDMRFLDPDLKEEVVKLEMLAEKNGACGGLMPFVNKGVWEALAREVCFVIVGNAHLLVDNKGLLYMMDDKKQILGEYVTPEQRAEILRTKPDTHFLSDDFIMHPEVEISGEPYFLIDEIKFDYIRDIPGVTRVTSGSTSTLSDDMIRTVMGHPGPDQWTHLIGFDIKP